MQKVHGRSIPGFDLHEALINCSTYLDKCGGHSMAVGLSLKTENFEKFKIDFENYAEKFELSNIIPVIQMDEQISLKDVNLKAVKELDMLEPFGEANRQPLFLFKDLKINSIRTLSEGKHIKLTLQENHYYIDAIGFNLGNLIDEYKIGDKIDVAGTLEINKFNSREIVQILLKDIRKSC